MKRRSSILHSKKLQSLTGGWKQPLVEFDKDMNEISRYSIEFVDNNNAIIESKVAMELEKFIGVLDRRTLR